MSHLKHGSLGWDFGNYSSKCSFAYTETDRQTKILRVSLDTGGEDEEDHPERDPYGRQQYEFIALAGLNGNGLVTGRKALALDVNFPLKTILLFLSGIRRISVLRAVPGGVELLEAYGTGRVTKKMMDKALHEHFSFLRDQCLLRATHSCIAIRTIVISYPNYLCRAEQEDDHEKYIDQYLKLCREVWKDYPHPIELHTVSEGQATASYVTDRTSIDEVAMPTRRVIFSKDLKHVTNHPDIERGLSLVVFDMGSSSLNIQSQTYYSDGDQGFARSQSNSGENWIPGSLGGSHMSNAKVREIVRMKLDTIFVGQVPDGEIAKYLEDFESKKIVMDISDPPKKFNLQGGDSGIIVRLNEPNLKGVFDGAFGKGIQLVEEEITYLYNLGRPFGIIFCGGSFSNPGLRKIIRTRMQKIRDQGESSGKRTLMEYAFLRTHDSYWMTAVSVGAALSVMVMPPAYEVLDKSGIGIQRSVLTYKNQRKAAGAKRCWEPEHSAQLLLARACGEPPKVILQSNNSRQNARFVLVCDPTYYTDTIDATRDADGRFKRIRIGSEADVVHGPIATYDLDFEIRGEDVPGGDLEFHIGGFDAPAISQQTPGAELAQSKHFEVVLTCHSVEQGVIRFHRRARRWKLRVKTDPASKLLIVDDVTRMPLWCRTCQQQLIREVAWMCKACNSCTLCGPCYAGRKYKHVHKDFVHFDATETRDMGEMDGMNEVASADGEDLNAE